MSEVLGIWVSRQMLERAHRGYVHGHFRTCNICGQTYRLVKRADFHGSAGFIARRADNQWREFR